MKIPFVKGPLSIVHFVTKKCNARCSHCFIDFDNPEIFKDELKVEEINKITKSVGKFLRNVNLTGGEPFLRTDLLDIAKCYFDNTNIKTMYITTNGFFTGAIKDFIDKFVIAGYDKLLIFSLSIDDLPDRHNANRKVEGLFDAVIKTYNMIRAYNLPNVLVNVNLTVVPANYKNIVGVYDYLVDFVGIKSFTTTIVREEGVRKIPQQLKNDLLMAYTALNNKIKKDVVGGKIEGYLGGFVGKILNSKNLVLQNILEKSFLHNEFVTPCYAGELFLVIEPDGVVRPCEILKEVGNLRDFDFDLMKLLAAPKAKELRKWIKQTKCRCSYECVHTINILFNSKHFLSLLKNVVKLDFEKIKHLFVVKK